MPFTQTMPKLSPTMETGTIAKWHKKEGEFVDAGELMLEVATDKATVEYNALDSGWLRKILVAEGQEAEVNRPIAIFTEKQDESIEGYQTEGAAQPAAAAPPAPPAAAQPAAEPARPAAAEGQRIKASPLAKKLALEKGLDLASVQGTGPGGRIVSRDLAKAEVLSEMPAKREIIFKETPGAFEELSLSQMRKTIAKRLQEAKATIPHFYITFTIDAGPLVAMREHLTNWDVKISFNDCVVKACAWALKQHPNINTGFNAANQSIIQFKTVDICVAVSIEGGLITPIIRYADQKTLVEISAEIRALAKRARDGKLSPEEFVGGSFTISNLGMLGVDHFQAIINPPQAAILAVGAILDQPVVKNNQVVPGKVMSLSLSADHRVIDGLSAAEFLKTLKKCLENPSILLT